MTMYSDGMQNELDRLREENAALRRERDEAVAASANGLSRFSRSFRKLLETHAAQLAVWKQAWADVRDAVLNARYQLAETETTGYQVNDVLGVIDDHEPKDDAGRKLLEERNRDKKRLEAAAKLREAFEPIVDKHSCGLKCPCPVCRACITYDDVAK